MIYPSGHVGIARQKQGSPDQNRNHNSIMGKILVFGYSTLANKHTKLNSSQMTCKCITYMGGVGLLL